MKIKLQLGKTYNLGNYESLRIDVGLEDECNPEEYEEKCKEIYDKVTDFFVAVYNEVKPKKKGY